MLCGQSEIDDYEDEEEDEANIISPHIGEVADY